MRRLGELLAVVVLVAGAGALILAATLGIVSAGKDDSGHGRW